MDNKLQTETGWERVIQLEYENMLLRKALEKVRDQGYNERCLFCGFKDKVIKETLERGED